MTTVRPQATASARTLPVCARSHRHGAAMADRRRSHIVRSAKRPARKKHTASNTRTFRITSAGQALLLALIHSPWLRTACARYPTPHGIVAAQRASSPCSALTRTQGLSMVLAFRSVTFPFTRSLRQIRFMQRETLSCATICA